MMGEEQAPYQTTADPFNLAEWPVDHIAVLTGQELEKLYRQLLGTIHLVSSLQGCKLEVKKTRMKPLGLLDQSQGK